MKIVDTNILLENPSLIENNNFFITTGVLRELDYLKNNINPETAEKARAAAIYLSRNLSNINFIETDNSEYKELSVDDGIIKVAEKLNLTILSNDVCLKLKAISKGLKTEGLSKKEDYSGIFYYPVLTDENRYNEELDLAFNGIIPNRVELYENQYLIFQDKNFDNEVLAIFKYTNSQLTVVNETSIKNKYINYIKPRNPEQVCLFDALKEKKNTIVLTNSKYGAGKSFIMNNYAFSQLEKGEIQKIVYVPNNSIVANSMELGFLPGDQNSKLQPFLGSMADLIGFDQINYLIDTEQLEVVPLAFIRGRNFSNSIIIVNEAQNLTEEHIKLLIGRVGENSRIFFDSDFAQADSALFKNKSGVKLLTKLRNSERFSKIFSCVQLLTTERSETACAAAYLSELN